MPSNRRKFIGQSFASLAGLTATAMVPTHIFGHNLHNTSRPEEIILQPNKPSNIKESIRSVSYTHLTLPTIYSV